MYAAAKCVRLQSVHSRVHLLTAFSRLPSVLTARPWPWRFNISGAKYSGVPQKECAPEVLLLIPSLLRPKSVNRTWPRSSRSTWT